MRVVRDRWGEKWVRTYDPPARPVFHVPFRWTSPSHVFTYLWQLGCIPEADVDG